MATNRNNHEVVERLETFLIAAEEHFEDGDIVRGRQALDVVNKNVEYALGKNEITKVLANRYRKKIRVMVDAHHTKKFEWNAGAGDVSLIVKQEYLPASDSTTVQLVAEDVEDVVLGIGSPDDCVEQLEEIVEGLKKVISKLRIMRKSQKRGGK